MKIYFAESSLRIKFSRKHNAEKVVIRFHHNTMWAWWWNMDSVKRLIIIKYRNDSDQYLAVGVGPYWISVSGS